MSLIVAAVGAVGVVAPTALLGAERIFETVAGLYAAAAFRVLFGAALWLAAARSRAPTVLRVLGVVALVGGLATPFIGVERVRGMLDWVAAQGPALVRAQGVFALVLGGALTYAVLPRARH
jgi:hypothetical protein